MRLARGEDGTGKLLAAARRRCARSPSAGPRSLDALARVPGMGEAKAARFGPAFLEIVAEA